METYTYPHFPSHLSNVHVALYTLVSNSASLKKSIIEASTAKGVDGDNQREAVNFAFIDARLITSRLHLKTAIYQAILAESQSSLRTRTVHSEILWVLNPTNNITEAIRRYGVSDSCMSLFVVRITSPETTDIQQKMNSVVHGQLSPLEELENITDWQLVKKYHKLNTEAAIMNTAGDIAREHAVIDNIVTSSVAMKSVSA